MSDGQDTRPRAPSPRDPRPPHHAHAPASVDPAIQAYFSAAIREVYERFVAHVDATTEKQNQQFASGFPDADPHKHRLNHESEARDRDAMSKLKWGLAEKIAYGIGAVLVWFFWNGGLATIKLWMKSP